MSHTRIVIKHGLIRDAMTQLGYPVGGVCFGLTHKWIEAIILGPQEEQKYLDRLHFIANYHAASWKLARRHPQQTVTSDLFTQINAAKKKAMNRELLTERDMQFLEVLAFFNGVALFQISENYSDVFKVELKQADVNDIEQFAQSKMAETEQQSMECFYSVPRIFDLKTLSAYFRELEKIQGLEKDQLIIGLGSDKHRIGLKYNQKSSRWELFDANKLPPIVLSSDQDQLASQIMRAFKDDKITAFSFSVYSSLHFKNKNAIINQLEQIDKQFPINDERLCQLKNSRGYSIVDIAALKNITHKLELLTNYLAFDDGTPFLHRAAKKGNVVFCQKVFALNPTINLNIRNARNNCPIHWAVLSNRLEFIHFLLEHHAALNLAGSNGNLPLHLAIKYKHKMAAKLLLSKMEPNDLVIKNKKGNTPFHLAAQAGQVTIIKALLKKTEPNALMIKNNKGETALDIAIKYRKNKTIKLLQSHLLEKKTIPLDVMFKPKQASHQITIRHQVFCWRMNH